MEVYMFLRWYRVDMGEDKFKLFIERLAEFDVGIKMNSIADYVIKGDGIVGYARAKGFISGRLREKTVKWLSEKCKESKDAEYAVRDIFYQVYGRAVNCEDVSKPVVAGAFEVSLGVIVNANSSDTRLLEVLTEFLGEPNLIRPY